MFVHTKFPTFLFLLLTFSQTHFSVPTSDLIRPDDDSINHFINFVINVCKGDDQEHSCQNLLTELTTLSSSVSEMRRRDLLVMVLKNSVWRVESAMIGMREDTNLLEEMESAMLGVREDMNLLEEMMESAKDGMISSMEELLGGENPNLESYANVHTWLSGVLTCYMTCMDGISEGAYKRRVEPEVEDLISRAKVALAMFTSISPREDDKLPNGPSYRRILSDLITPEDLKKNPDVVVAKDGSGNYSTVNEGLANAPKFSKRRFVVYIKKGVYEEIVKIRQANVTLVGDGKDLTIITGSLSAEDGHTTFDTATVASNGNGFLAIDMCFRNTAGPEKGPAVALRVSGDMSVIYRCRIEGYQDALYPHQNRQFYRECYITGTVDFICGNAAAVFQFCEIVARKPRRGQANMITAQSRVVLTRNSGFSFQRCNFTASSDLAPVKAIVKTYLGRPWREYSRVVILQSYLGDLVDPAGWAPWNDNKTVLSTLFYGEYHNNGPGADTSRRVSWKGFKVITDPKEAAMFTVNQLLLGELWLNSTGVPYQGGL